VCQLYTYSCLLYAPSNRQPIKKRLMFLHGYGPIAIADWSIIVQCHLLIKHGLILTSIGAVVEMGILSALKRLPGVYRGPARGALFDHTISFMIEMFSLVKIGLCMF
jgi:uncharacterized membrane protein required for colicin V production